MAKTREEIERRLDAGDWLLVGEVAILFGVSRSTVHRMVSGEPPMVDHRIRAGRGGYRELNPVQVREQLSELRKVRAGSRDQSDMPS